MNSGLRFCLAASLVFASCSALGGPANAQTATFSDPYVSVSKTARSVSNQTASLPTPTPDRFGPVRLVPQEPISAPASPPVLAPDPKQEAKAPVPSCTISSDLAGKDAKALIASIAAEEEFDLALLNAIAKQESDFTMNRRSPAGALGLMQIMPATAASLGINPCDPNENVRGAIKLLRLLDQKYSGNIIYMLAAYNAGEDAVDRNGGIPLYRETTNYVTRILSTVNGWEIPTSKSSKAAPSKPIDEPNQPAANRWAQGFVLHVE